MEETASKCADCDVDLESGVGVVDDNVSDESVTVSVVSAENVKVIVEKKKKSAKAMSAKKPPKPPRAPRGFSLDSADQKLIRELAEMAKVKRARVERMKALMKMKEAKTTTTSSKNQLFGTLLTVLFFCVILFQGISSRTAPAATLQGSPMTPGATRGGILSIMQSQNLSANNA